MCPQVFQESKKASAVEKSTLDNLVDYTSIKTNEELRNQINQQVKEGREIKQSFFLGLMEHNPEKASEFISKMSKVSEQDFVKTFINYQLTEGMLLNLNGSSTDQSKGDPYIRLEGKFKPYNIQGVLHVFDSQEQSFAKKLLNSDIYLINDSNFSSLGISIGGMSAINIAKIDENLKSYPTINKTEFIQSVVANELMTQAVVKLYNFMPEDKVDWSGSSCVLPNSNLKPFSSHQVHEFLSDAASLATNQALLPLLVENMVASKELGSSETAPYAYTQKFLDSLIESMPKNDKIDLVKINNAKDSISKVNANNLELCLEQALALKKANNIMKEVMSKLSKDEISNLAHSFEKNGSQVLMQDMVKTNPDLKKINKDLVSIDEKIMIEEQKLKSLVHDVASEYLKTFSKSDRQNISDKFVEQGRFFIKEIAKIQTKLPQYDFYK